MSFMKTTEQVRRELVSTLCAVLGNNEDGNLVADQIDRYINRKIEDRMVLHIQINHPRVTR